MTSRKRCRVLDEGDDVDPFVAVKRMTTANESEKSHGNQPAMLSEWESVVCHPKGSSDSLAARGAALPALRFASLLDSLSEVNRDASPLDIARLNDKMEDHLVLLASTGKHRKIKEAFSLCCERQQTPVHMWVWAMIRKMAKKAASFGHVCVLQTLARLIPGAEVVAVGWEVLAHSVIHHRWDVVDWIRTSPPRVFDGNGRWRSDDAKATELVVSHGNSRSVAWLIDAGLPMDDLAVVAAIVRGNVCLLRTILDEAVQVRNLEPFVAASEAAFRGGKRDVAEVVVHEYGFPINSFVFTAAIESGNWGMVMAVPRSCPVDPPSALCAAIRARNRVMVTRLVTRYRGRALSSQAANEACAQGDVDTLHELISYGCPVNKQECIIVSRCAPFEQAAKIVRWFAHEAHATGSDVAVRSLLGPTLPAIVCDVHVKLFTLMSELVVEYTPKQLLAAATAAIRSGSVGMLRLVSREFRDPNVWPDRTVKELERAARDSGKQHMFCWLTTIVSSREREREREVKHLRASPESPTDRPIRLDHGSEFLT